MQEEAPFDPISRDTVSSQVRAQLMQRITSGELAPGSPMPSERALSERFQVARTSVREAMQGLLSTGVVERRGNRSYVAEHLPDVVVAAGADRKSFVSDLFETRRVLEVPLFQLAAVRADDDARDRVRVLGRSFDDQLDIQGFLRLDREFHTTIAASSGNPLLIELYGKVLDQLFRTREFDEMLLAEKNRSEVKRNIVESSTAHQAIASAFIGGDPAIMGQVTEAHLGELGRVMVDDLV